MTPEREETGDKFLLDNIPVQQIKVRRTIRDPCMPAKTATGAAVSGWCPRVIRECVEHEVEQRDDIETISDVVQEAMASRYNLPNQRSA